MGSLKTLLIASAVALLPLSLHAAQQASQKDLQRIQKNINEANQDVKNKKNAQARIARDLEQTDKELTRQRLELNRILREKQVALSELNRLQQKAISLQTRINGTKTEVGRLLNTQYRTRQAESIVLMLQNADPNEKGRQLRYLRYIQAANQKVIDDLTVQQQELAQQELEVQAQIRKIQGLIERQQKIVRELSKKKHSNLTESDKLVHDIRQNEKKIKTLQNDQARLSQLLKKINTEQQRKKANNKSSRHQVVKVEVESKTTKTTTTKVGNVETHTNTETTLVPMQEITPVASSKQSGFGQLQGKLPMPVAGHISGRFGGARAFGGAFNGIYIAASGQPVSAVAQGEVAYAGNLKGYGNTVVIDHDHTYVTVYAGLSSLSVGRGQQVSAHQTLGRSGALPNESEGLYFEIRYHTNPLNPSQWIQ